MLTALFTLPASAETIVGLATFEDFETIGLTSTKEQFPGGTVILQNEAASFSLAYDDDWGIAPDNKNYRKIKIGGSNEIMLDRGVVGNTNPTFISYQNGVMSAGSVFELKAKKDGWITIFTKLNPNKQYVVFEGETAAIAYTLGVAGPDYLINYTLPADQSGYINFNAQDASKYFIEADGIATHPQFPYMVAGLESAPAESTGFITFRVSAGKTYYFSALGSKMVCGGFVFTDGSEEPAVTFCSTEELPEVKFKTSLSTPEVTPPDEPTYENPSVSGNSTIVLADKGLLEDVGIYSTKSEVAGGTIILDSEVGSFGLAYDDDWGSSLDYKNYRNIKIGNSDEFSLNYGAVGNTNPDFVSYQEGVMSAGAVFEIKAKKDGWMTVFTKLNPNKQYIVFEGASGAIAYTLGVAGPDYLINYTLPSDKNGYIDFDAVDASRYFITATKQSKNEAGVPLWTVDGTVIASETKPEGGQAVMEEIPGETKPQFPWLVAGMEVAPGESSGFLTFKVSAGKTYYFSALGSKMICGGFVFTDSAVEPAVTFSATEEFPKVQFETGLPATALAAGDDFEYEGIWYTVLDEEAKTCRTREGVPNEDWTQMIGGNSSVEGYITIPPTVSDGMFEYTVEEIGNGSFGLCFGLTGIQIPETVTRISDGAFNRATALEIAILPESLKEIRPYAFTDCSKLRNINLPMSLQSIEQYMFYGCISLTSINIPDNLTHIKSFAFNNCESLTAISLPSTIENIEGNVFAGCNALMNISYQAVSPISLLENIFDMKLYETATLNMPNALLADIQATVPWNKFTHIKAKDGMKNLYENVIAEMYPGLNQLVAWGNGISVEISMDEKGGECLKITNTEEDTPWSSQLAYENMYEIGETYYFTFDVKGDYGIITSDFQNLSTYTFCGSCNDFEINSEWTTVTISGKPDDNGEVVNRWVANIGDYVGTFYIRNMKIYTLVEDQPVNPPVEDDKIIIAEMYPGPSKLFSWGDNLTEEIVTDENDGECFKITHSDPGEIWSAQFAYDCLYKIGETYYFTFEVKGDYGVVSSNFQNSNTYVNCGNCEDFEIRPEWTTVTIKGTPNDEGVIVNRWVANIGDYEGALYIRNMKIYTQLPIKYHERIITEMYPGPGKFFSWGDNLTEETVTDENGEECFEITHSDPGDKWRAQFAYDCLYKPGVTYYFTFDIRGDSGVITSDFQNSKTYETYGSFDVFEITQEWTTVTIKGIPENRGEIVNRWVANIGDYDGTFYIRNVKLYTLVDEPVVAPVVDNEDVIAEMYPGPYKLLRWGDGLITDIWMDENGEECLELTKSNPDTPWSAQFAFDYPYIVGKTYYFTFDVKGDYGVITSEFNNISTYVNCGNCNDFEITPEWTSITVKGTPEDRGEDVNRWVANVGDYDGTFYIRNMKIYTLIDESFSYGGVKYSILDAKERTCGVITVDSISDDVLIPEVVPFKAFEYKVEEVFDNAFAGLGRIGSISLPSTVENVGENAFEGCERLTSLVWRGNRRMPVGVVDAISNPNLLVYVDSVKFAPEGLDHNVVADGVCDRLVLTPGYAFTPVADFTASSSSMTKEFLQMTPVDGCAGWETIVLPFDVAKVASPEGKPLTAFEAVTDVKRQRPYWLYEADDAGEWTPASSIKAGIPYIISMPNNPRYNPAYNIHGAVTFSNPNPQLITTGTTSPYVTTWTSGREFRSLWLPLDEKDAVNAMGLNVGINDLTDDDGELLAPGSAFHVGVLPKPLEAYVIGNDNSKAFRIKGFQSAVLTMPDEDGLKITQEDGILMLQSSRDRIVEIFSADGTLLRKMNVVAGTPMIVDALPQGVCIIAGRKVMIK